MKKNLMFFIICIPVLVSGQKTENRNSIFLAFGGSCFTKSNSTGSTEFYCYNQNYGFAAGYEKEFILDPHNGVNIDVGFSHYKSSYHFVNNNLSTRNSILYSNFFITPEYSFKIKKWIQLNAGLSLNLLLNNKFQNDSVARMISWTTPENRSRMKIFYPAYSFGLQFNITSRISVKYTGQMSVIPIITLTIDANNSAITTKLYQRTDLFTLYYKIN